MGNPKQSRPNFPGVRTQQSKHPVSHTCEQRTLVCAALVVHQLLSQGGTRRGTFHTSKGICETQTSTCTSRRWSFGRNGGRGFHCSPGVAKDQN